MCHLTTGKNPEKCIIGNFIIVLTSQDALNKPGQHSLLHT